MKNLKLIISAIFALNLSLFADISLGVEYGHFSTEDNKVYNVESLSNIVGGNSSALTVKVGSSNTPSQGILKNIKTNVFVYGTFYDSEKHNEMVFGIGCEGQTKKLFNLFRLKGEVRAGGGYQNSNGDSIDLNSNVSTINYITGNYTTGNFKGVLTKDTSVIEYDIGVGAVFDTGVKNLTIDTGVIYHSKNYSFSYLIDGDSNGGNTMSGVVQDNYEFSLGLNYSF